MSTIINKLMDVLIISTFVHGFVVKTYTSLSTL